MHPSGELQFDAFSRFGIKTQWTNAVVKRSGSTLYWGIDGPDDIIDAVPGVRLLQWVSPFDSATFADVSWPYRVMAKVMSRVFDAALHGAVPPLRVLRTPLAEHRLSAAAIVEIGSTTANGPGVSADKL